MLGHLMEWLFSGLGGIRQDEASIAFKHIVIKPSPVGDVRSARTSYESPYGTIVSDWNATYEGFTIQVEVPANTSASIYLPTTQVDQITESGIAIKELPSASIRQENGYTVVTVGSGTYKFNI